MVQVSSDLPHTDNLMPVRPWLLRLIRPVAALAMQRWWRVRVHGAHHLPSGGAILAANHVGLLDGPLLVGLLRRDAFAMVKQELITGVVGRLLLLAGQVPVDRRRNDPWAIRRCVRLLRDGQLLVVFPEGFRGDGEFRHARHGAAYLALVTGAPVVPVALLGTREAGQTTATLPRRGAAVHVVLGKPLQVPVTPWPRRRRDVADWTEWLRVRLAAHVEHAQQAVGMPLPGPPVVRSAPQEVVRA